MKRVKWGAELNLSFNMGAVIEFRLFNSVFIRSCNSTNWLLWKLILLRHHLNTLGKPWFKQFDRSLIDKNGPNIQLTPLSMPLSIFTHQLFVVSGGDETQWQYYMSDETLTRSSSLFAVIRSQNSWLERRIWLVVSLSWLHYELES